MSRSEEQGQHPGQERMLTAAGSGTGSGSAAASSRAGAKAASKAGAKSGSKSGKGAASGSAKAKKNDGPERPGASGHRFGPDLACSECGILWDVHQRDPKPCKIETVADAFARRPSGDFANTASTPAEAETGEGASTSSASSTASSTPSSTASTAAKTTEAVADSTNKTD